MVSESSGTALPGDEHYDAVCVGFGISGLAFAVAHRERNPSSKVLFLEAESESSWRPLSKLPGQDMTHTFMSDLITTENPRSRFTFIKYLHATGRLVNFTNVGKVNPAGELYEDYLRWAAAKFENLVRWDTRVVRVVPVQDASDIVSEWKMITTSGNGGQSNTYVAKRLIMATGRKSYMPTTLQSPDSQIVHSSRCVESIQRVLRSNSTANIAIIGNGEDAAELLTYLHGIRGRHRATLFTQHSSLQPATDTSYTTDRTSAPSEVTSQRLPPELRSQNQSSSVNIATSARLIEQIYELQYTQRIKTPKPADWRFQIIPNSIITAASQSDGKTQLTVLDGSTNQAQVHSQPFDLVIAATGYEQGEQQRLLAPLNTLFEDNRLSVDGHYRVNLRNKLVANGRGLWVLGSLRPEQWVSTNPFAASRSC